MSSSSRARLYVRRGEPAAAAGLVPWTRVGLVTLLPILRIKRASYSYECFLAQMACRLALLSVVATDTQHDQAGLRNRPLPLIHNMIKRDCGTGHTSMAVTIDSHRILNADT